MQWNSTLSESWFKIALLLLLLSGNRLQAAGLSFICDPGAELNTTCIIHSGIPFSTERLVCTFRDETSSQVRRVKRISIHQVPDNQQLKFRVPEGNYHVTIEFLNDRGMSIQTVETSYHSRVLGSSVSMSDPLIRSGGIPILDEIPAGSQNIEATTIVYGLPEKDLTLRMVLYRKGQELGRLGAIQYSAVAERISVLRKGAGIRPFVSSISTGGLAFGEYYLEFFISDEERILYEAGQPLYVHWDQLPLVIRNWRSSLGTAAGILPASWCRPLVNVDSAGFISYWLSLDDIGANRPYTAMETFYYRVSQMQQILSLYAIPEDPQLLRLACWYGIPESIIPSTRNGIHLLTIAFPEAGRTCFLIQANGTWVLKGVQYAV